MHFFAHRNKCPKINVRKCEGVVKKGIDFIGETTPVVAPSNQGAPLEEAPKTLIHTLA